MHYIYSLPLPSHLDSVHNLCTAVLPSPAAKHLLILSRQKDKSAADCGKLNFNGEVHAKVCLLCF